MHTTLRSFMQNSLVKLLVCQLAIVPNLVFAAQASLADVPLFQPAKVPPNILFTFDNSGSMAADHPVDTEIGRAYNGTYINTGIVVGGTVWHTRGEACYSNPAFNALWYDNTKRYDPPYVATSAGADSRLPGYRATDTVILNLASAPLNGYAAYYGLFGNAWNDYDDMTANLTTNNFVAAGWGWNPFTSANPPVFFPYYHEFTAGGSPTPGVCHSPASYTLREIRPTITSYPKSVNRTDCAAVTCTYAEEIRNFATWFSYYRSRSNSVKGGVGEAARVIDPTTRVGFQTIGGVTNNNQFGSFLPIAPFTGTQKGEWYRNLYIQFPWYGTLLQRATGRAGEYFRNRTRPGTSTQIADPIQYSCQQNYHILSTDGYWNPGDQAGAPAGTGNYDQIIPNTNPDLITALRNETGNNSLVAGNNWPDPYRKGTSGDGIGNTLADVAMYYWMTDLRPGMPNNVPVNAKDQANWQHMVQYGIAFGAKGVAPFVDILPPANPPYTTIPGDGNADSLPTTWAYSSGGSESWKIDDMWHSAVNGHGSFFNVNSFETLARALGNALNDISSRSASGVAPAVSGANLNRTSGANPLAFGTTYVSGEWTGNLIANAIDPVTGEVNLAPTWDAQTRMTSQLSANGWDVNRRVVTRNSSSGVGVPFRALSGLSSSQRAALDNNQSLLNYLRGDRSNEDTPALTRSFRQRTTASGGATLPAYIGDIVDATPAFVAAPDEIYLDSTNPGFSAFYNANKTDLLRPPVIYVGSNDGMLHAIDATSGASGGTERWAYIPSMLFRNDGTGLKNLSWRPSDPLPNKFKHRFYVNGEITTASVDFTRTGGVSSGSPDWRTILVGSLRKGGAGYYAIDVTDPDSMTSEAAVASKVLWEFPPTEAGDSRMGYSYGKPLVFKVKGLGWVVAVSSGYNNPDGRGYVWLLNPKTGSVIHTIQFAQGNSATPLNVGHMSVFYPNLQDGTADRLVATDLTGNIWRVPLDNIALNGTTIISQPFASFPGKPIMAAPTIGVGSLNVSDVWIAVGTGRLLDTPDLTSGIINEVYSIKDGTTAGPNTSLSNINSSNLQTVGVNAVTYSPISPSLKGWKMTLQSGEFVDKNPIAFAGVLLLQSTLPSTSADPCVNLGGFDSRFYMRSLDAGFSVLSYGGTTQPYYQPPAGTAIAGFSIVRTRGTPDGLGGFVGAQDRILLRTTGSSNQTVKLDVSKDTSSDVKTLSGQRLNFRLIIRD